MTENRNIEAFITESFLIDIDYGLTALHQYWSDLALIQGGVSFADLGYAEKRARQKPQFSDDIALLTLEGVMRMEDGISHRGIKSLAQDIEFANKDPRYKGIMLEINSGGGEALSGEYLKNALAESYKPVVAYGHTVGSAAYLAALGTNEIIMSGKMARAGSIGAMITINKKLLDEYKANYMSVYASQSTEKNSEFRSMLEGNSDLIQKSVDGAAQIFIDAVMEARNIKDSKATKGGMFYADEALRIGLIDGIGSRQYAIKRLRSHINLL